MQFFNLQEVILITIIYINNIFTMFNSFQKFIHVMVLVFRLAGSLWLVTGLYRTKLEPS